MKLTALQLCACIEWLKVAKSIKHKNVILAVWFEIILKDYFELYNWFDHRNKKIKGNFIFES